MNRCFFHEGYLDSLPGSKKYDAATCFLVSQFILEEPVRVGFFREIADRLTTDGVLVSADLASGADPATYPALMLAWMNMMAGADISVEKQNKMKAAYAKDVAILPPQQIASLIQAAGFDMPVQFYQAGLIHAWFANVRQEVGAI